MTNTISLNILVLALPLMSFIFIGLFGRHVGTYGAMAITVTNLLLVAIYTITCALPNSFHFIESNKLWDWLSINQLQVPFSVGFDTLTVIMFFVVSVVSACVHVYSTVYMYTDPFLSRFLSYLSLFSFFMLLLVSAGNYLMLFIGWEGVGLSSYLLISFWYTRVQAGKAATKAFLINKIGDLFLLSGISIAFVLMYNLDFSALNNTSNYLTQDFTNLIVFFLFLGAVGKSAQVGLHAWLPDAMEGPTPVSALIHAATMVTAGVFLIIRSSYLFEYSANYLYFMAVWGGLTAIISGTIGAVSNDIKKIIAYSTCSQLGYMVLACGVSAYQGAFFHLFNHAFFKALLFLSAGSVIHLMSNEQDIRKFGGLAKLSPVVYINILIASLALAGFPFLAGFYSKDLIIEASLTRFWVGGQLLYWLAILSAILTASYSFRLLEQTFWGTFTGFKNTIVNHAKATNLELIVLTVLASLSITSGYLFRDVFVGLGTDFFSSDLQKIPTYWNLVDLEFLGFEIKVMPLALTCLAFEFQHLLFEHKWFFNEVFNRYLSLPVLISGRHFYEQYEKNILEDNGPLFITKLYVTPQTSTSDSILGAGCYSRLLSQQNNVVWWNKLRCRAASPRLFSNKSTAQIKYQKFLDGLSFPNQRSRVVQTMDWYSVIRSGNKKAVESVEGLEYLVRAQGTLGATNTNFNKINVIRRNGTVLDGYIVDLNTKTIDHKDLSRIIIMPAPMRLVLRNISVDETDDWKLDFSEINLNSIQALSALEFQFDKDFKPEFIGGDEVSGTDNVWLCSALFELESLIDERVKLFAPKQGDPRLEFYSIFKKHGQYFRELLCSFTSKAAKQSVPKNTRYMVGDLGGKVDIYQICECSGIKAEREYGYQLLDLARIKQWGATLEIITLLDGHPDSKQLISLYKAANSKQPINFPNLKGLGETRKGSRTKKTVGRAWAS